MAHQNDSNNRTIKSNSTLRLANEEVKNMFYHMYGDKNRYLQIVLNFLSNSIHYTKKGGSISINLVLIEEQIIKPRNPMHSQVDVADFQADRQLMVIEENRIEKK